MKLYDGSPAFFLFLTMCALSGCGGSGSSKYDDANRGPRVVPVSVCNVSSEDVVFLRGKLALLKSTDKPQLTLQLPDR